LPTLDPILVLAANYCVALLFLFSGLAKLTAFRVFRATLADYALLPERLVTPAAVLLTGLELGLALAACLPPSAAAAMYLAASLLLLYAGAIGINLQRGRRDIDCGCTGPATRQLLSGWLLLRNVCIAALALVGAAVPGPRSLGTADAVLIGLSILGAMALYAAVNQLMANAPRLDALDSIMDGA